MNEAFGEQRLPRIDARSSRLAVRPRLGKVQSSAGRSDPVPRDLKEKRPCESENDTRPLRGNRGPCVYRTE